MTRPAWNVKDYDSANLYLAGGRKTWERPMYIRGLRLKKMGGNIAIVDKWCNVVPILFHTDGTLTIQCPTAVVTNWGGTWNPLLSQSLRRTLTQFSQLQNVFVRQRQVYITTSDATKTPSKVQKCRGCSGLGKVDGWCSPSYCETPNPCEKHPLSSGVYWHYDECEHGKSSSHRTYKTDTCYRCKGEGKFDYGNKLVSIPWDGSPIRLINGRLVRQLPTELEKAIQAYAKLDS